MSLLPIPGIEQGRRVERVEWGRRFTRDNAFGRKGQVEKCFGPEQAEGYDGAFYPAGPKSFVPVRRLVVTYTSDWEPA